MNRLGVLANSFNTLATGVLVVEVVSPETIDMSGNAVGAFIEQHPVVSTLFFASAALSGWVQMARSAHTNNHPA